MSNPTSGQLSPKQIFTAARGMSDSAQREDYVNAQCGDDLVLRQKVDALLTAAGTAVVGGPLDVMVDAFGAEVTVAYVPERQVTGELPQLREIGPYKLLEQIGEGAFGTVYMAEQTTPVRRKVAVKILKAGMDSAEVIARFEAERQALAMMDHPNISRVIDGGTTEMGRPYFVMELVRGIPLTAYCDEARLTTEERLELFIDVCRAVQHAHQKGIIHRDLKPSNVMVTMHDDKAVAKIIDFGIAKALNQKLTDRTLFTGYQQMLGTPLYMSPEQAQMSGIDIDTRSDVYSLGVILYELLTGTTPFDKESLARASFDDLRRIIREQEPLRPSARITTLEAQARSTMADRRRIDHRKVSEELRGELDWIVMKTLEKDRNRRYESASAFAADIRRYLDDEPVVACPPTMGYRLSKSIRKHRAAMITISLVAVGLVVAVTGTSWQAIRATRAEHQSDERLAKLSVEQKSTTAALLAAELAEEEQRRMRIEAEDFALREQEAAKQQSDLRAQAERSEREARWNVYVSKLYAMQEMLRDRDFGRLDTMLRESVPGENEPDFRGWEWNYLRECVNSMFTDLELEGNALSGPLAWNPVANEFATFSAPHFIDIWNADTVKSVRRLDCHESISEMEWSPDGNRIAVGTSGEYELIVLEAGVGTTAWRSIPLSPPDALRNRPEIIALSWNCDNKRIAVGNRSGEIAIVDLEAKTTSTLRKPEKVELLGDLDWHPDGNHLAAGLRYGERTIFDVRDKSAIELDKRIGLAVGEAVCWSPGGDLLAVSEGRLIRIADEFGKTICELIGHNGAVKRLCWINDTSLVSAANDQIIRTWDIAKAAEVNRFKIHDAPVTHLALSSRDSFLSVGGGQVRLSKLSTRQRETVSRIVTGDASETSSFATNASDDKNAIQELKWSPNGTRICVVGEISHGNSVGGACGVRSSASLRSINAYQTNLCKGITWSRDGTQLLRTAVFDRMQADDFRTGIPIQSVECNFLGDPIAFWSPSTRFVTTHGGPTSPFVRDARTLKSLFDWSVYSPARGNAVTWSPSELHYISGGYGSPMLFSMDGIAREFPDKSSNASFAIAWHPSEKVVALGNGTGNIVVRESTTLEVLSVLKGHTSDVTDLTFSPNGCRLASASYDGTVRIWDFATGAELMQLTVVGARGFSQVEWSPDGFQLAAGTTLREVIVFDSNEMPQSLGTVAAMETGAVLQAFQKKTGERFEWHREVPRLAWRDPLVVLQRCAGGLDEPVDIVRFDAESADFVVACSRSPEEFSSLMQAWLVLIEAHNDPRSAVTLADRMLLALNENNLVSDKEQSLGFQLEALMLAGQRMSDLDESQQASDYFARAEQLGTQLTTDFPTQAMYWRQRLAIAALQSNELTKQYKQLLRPTDRGDQDLVESLGRLRNHRERVDALYDDVPQEAFFFQVTDGRYSRSWTNAVSEAELKFGRTPTFLDDWTGQFSSDVQHGSANHYVYYQVALCHLIAGDHEAYRSDCELMLQKFGNSDDKAAREFTCWTSALAPNAVDNYMGALELAEKTESTGGSSTYHVGALLYRAGKFELARERLLKHSEADSGNSPAAYVWCFLSMTEHQLGNVESSQTWYERASQFTSQLLADEQSGKHSVAWNRRATLRLLEAEARAMIDPVIP